MARRLLLGVLVAFAVAGTVAFAQGQGRTLHEESTETWEGVLVSGCIDDYGNTFDVYNAYTAEARDTTIYDKTGAIKQAVRSVRFLSDEYWNGDVPKNRLYGKPGERNEIRFTYENGELVLIQQSGGMMRVIVPGYGPIYIETGHARITPTFEVIFNSGHNHFWDGDPAAAEALCNALK